jgi:predicted CoA-binding protein
MKKTLVLGASPNPLRFSNKMVKSLVRHKYEVVALGLREGEISSIKILTGKPVLRDIHTITLYIGLKGQLPVYEYILSLNPKRVIFNPGTENPEFMKLVRDQGIEVVYACSLEMLSSAKY